MLWLNIDQKLDDEHTVLASQPQPILISKGKEKIKKSISKGILVKVTTSLTIILNLARFDQGRTSSVLALKLSKRKKITTANIHDLLKLAR